LSAATFSASLGAVPGSRRSVGPTLASNCWMSASFFSWSCGTKLASVSVWATCGSLLSRSAAFAASSRDGITRLIELMPTRGSSPRSSKVAIDSAFGLRRWIGSKSKVR